jgi:hypothetical protein
MLKAMSHTPKKRRKSMKEMKRTTRLKKKKGVLGKGIK